MTGHATQDAHQPQPKECASSGRRIALRRLFSAGLFAVIAFIPAAGQERTDAPHRTFGLPCETCHTTGSWSQILQPASFDHGQTAFPLERAHAAARCAACHRGQGFGEGLSRCAACHEDYHHGDLGDRCEQCHTPAGWRAPGRFLLLHEATRFPLLGAHRLADCRACHVNQQKDEYAPVASDCAGCHMKDYAAAKILNHVSLRLPLHCEQCHRVEQPAWIPASFDHSAFPLRGSHAAAPCSACHTNGFSRNAVTCIDCHRDDYSRTTNPDHAASGYPTACATCHSQDSWRPARFDHSLTSFPLTGRHASTACDKCHAGGRYTGTPTACVSCHLADYTATTDPNHPASGFPTACENCHTTAGWKPASFDHSKSGFPLTGAHATTACSACHAGGYSGTPTACLACHKDDYNRAANPQHASEGYPTDCTMCHTTSGWTPSTFNHDAQWFRINSGAHRGRWTVCADCHTVPGAISTYSCIDCHEHSNKSRVDNDHGGVRGYSYASTECYRCHARV